MRPMGVRLSAFRGDVMPPRHCLVCGNLSSSTRCPSCQRAQQRARNAHRGDYYGAAHRSERRAWQRFMDDGNPVCCWRPDCGKPINPQSWHLGHRPHGQPSHPECVACNLTDNRPPEGGGRRTGTGA